MQQKTTFLGFLSETTALAAFFVSSFLGFVTPALTALGAVVSFVAADTLDFPICYSFAEIGIWEGSGFCLKFSLAT